MKLRNIATALLLSIMLTATAAAPKYIFFFIGDGMGNGPVMAAQTYLRQNGDNNRLNMLSLPVASQAMTYSASTPVTDSAAAGTALATGYKTNNGMLGVTPDTIAVTSIATRLHDAGYGVGLITTVAPDDATPGAFYAHVASRKQFTDINRQLAESGFEFFAGSGLRGLVDKKGNPTGAKEYITSKGYDIIYGLDNLDKSSSSRIILLDTNPFNIDNVGYTIDAREGMLTLPQMTQAAINHLSTTNPDAFFMMVEGGNIDHSLHSNDAATAIIETLEFDKTLTYALDFYRQHPDETLIIVTADHNTGGISIGDNTTRYNAYSQLLSHSRISKDALSDLCEQLLRDNALTSWDDARQLLSDKLGLFTEVELSAEQEQQLQEIFQRVFIDKKRNDQTTLYSRINEFAAVAVDMLNQQAGFGWTTLAHTGDTVPVFAIGVGAELFGSWNDNIDIPAKILRIAELEK